MDIDLNKYAIGSSSPDITTSVPTTESPIVLPQSGPISSPQLDVSSSTPSSSTSTSKIDDIFASASTKFSSGVAKAKELSGTQFESSSWTYGEVISVVLLIIFVLFILCLISWGISTSISNSSDQSSPDGVTRIDNATTTTCVNGSCTVVVCKDGKCSSKKMAEGFSDTMNNMMYVNNRDKKQKRRPLDKQV